MDTGRIPAALVTEAAAWRLAGLILERPKPAWHETVQRLASEMDEPGLRAAAEAAHGAVEGHYLALLGPGGPASPREAAYVGFGDPGQNLSELRAFYETFSYRPRTEDPPDHVAVAAGFAAYLRLKEAFALGEENDDAASTVHAARERFERDHLRRIAGPLTRKLEAHGPGTAWALAAAWVRDRVGEPETPPLPVLVDDDEGCLAP